MRVPPAGFALNRLVSALTVVIGEVSLIASFISWQEGSESCEHASFTPDQAWVLH